MVEELILERMQRLMVLGFEGQPGREVIEATGMMWVEKLRGYSAVRLAIAFDAIENRKSLRRDGGGWPTPGDIIAALPPYVREATPLPAEKQIPVDPEAAERLRAEGRAALADAVQRFGRREPEPPDEARIEANRQRVQDEIDRRGAAP